MSFGFGIGDFKAVAEVVIKVIDRVKSSPDQIKNTRQDVEAISAFIESEETNCLNGAMSPAERAQIQESLESCKGIVQDLQSELSKFGEASHVDKGIRAKFKRSMYVHSNLLASTLQDSYSARKTAREATAEVLLC
ncbi:unnamed protein product [Aureobasidium pullulans]|nr:unnamed protein product [Aureobasidium pullulans]